MMIQPRDNSIDQCIEQLLAVLDQDIEDLQDHIARLNELRSLVIRQDADALNQLLLQIRSRSVDAGENERKRQALRSRLAGLCRCDLKDMTLTRIETLGAGDKRSAVAARKIRLRELTGLLKTEYTGTRMLLTDCVRFNRQLLKGIFAVGKTDSVTYKQTGGTERQTDTVFMNVQF
jgi:hypothetical protein